MKIAPREVRAAREFLRKRGVRGLPPRQFAQSSQETGLSFSELLQSLAAVARRKRNGNNQPVR